LTVAYIICAVLVFKLARLSEAFSENK
jgi:hypothetical protein